MENKRTFEITDLAGENLENVRWHGNMTVYAIVSTTVGHEVRTKVDLWRGTNPKWKTPINFTLHDPSIHNNYLDLNIQFFCDRTFTSDKYIAGFSIPFKRLFDEISGNVESSRAVRYPVVNSAGREQGFVKFSYKFGELTKPTSQQQLSSSAQPKPTSQLPPQQRPPSQSPKPPSLQQPQPSQRPKRKPQSPEQPPPQQQPPSQTPQRPKRKPQSPEQPPPQEPRPSSQSTQQPRPPPQVAPPSGQQQLHPQQPRPPRPPQQQQYPQHSRPSPSPPPQQRPYPQQARPPRPRPQQRQYPQQARPPPPRPRRPPPQSTQNAAAFRAQFVATGQVQVPLSENSPNPQENPTEAALDNHIDQLNISVEAQCGIDPDGDNNIPGDNQFEYPENEAYGQMSVPEYENNENNHDMDEYQDNEEGCGYDGDENGEDYGDGEEVIEEGYQDDGVNNGEDYGGW